MLEIRNLTKIFNAGTVNEKTALSDLCLKLDDGDFVTVIGGNGAGKSTMLNMIAGVYPSDGGQILIDNVDVTELPEYKRAKYIGRVFQDPMMGTAADMWVEENLSIADRRGKRHGLSWAITKNDRRRYKEALTELGLGLENRLSTKMGLLSGGQRQRLGIARALYHNPEILVFDEATSALDTDTETAIMEAIESFHGKKTLVIIAHRLRTIAGCDIIYKVDNGKIVETTLAAEEH